MTPTPEEILESDVWKQALRDIEQDLWNDYGRLSLGNTDGLLKVQMCRWALHRISAEIAARLTTKSSINLHK